MPNALKPIDSKQLLKILALSKDATAIYINENLKIGFVNEAMLAFWDKPYDIIGQNFADAMPELIEQGFIDLLKSVWSSGKTYQAKDTAAELFIDGKHQTRYFDFIYRALLNEDGKTYAILHTATEVTERIISQDLLNQKEQKEKDLKQRLLAVNEEYRAANDQLTVSNDELNVSRRQVEEAEQFFRQAIDAANFGTWNLNTQTRELVTSPRLKELFGFNANDEPTLAECISQISPEHQNTVSEEIENAITKGGNYDLCYSVCGFRDNTIRWVRSVGSLSVDGNGNFETLAGVIMDITEQKQNEQLKNDFVSMVSHELKTPLTSLMGYVQMLQLTLKKSADARTIDMLSRSKSQIMKMNNMISGFLDLSRFDGGQLYLKFTAFSINELIKAVIEEVEVTTTTHSISLKTAEDIEITADKEKIGQVIQNLLSNSVKYSPHGKQIDVSYRKADENLVITIRDYGVGVKSEDINKLFSRFYRVQNNQTGTIAGFGIGLYLCAEIIKRHNGHIWIESDGENGSSFHFSLPLINTA